MPSVTASPAPALALLILAASIAASQAGVKCGDSPASPSPSPPPLTSNTTNSSAFRANILTLLSALPEAAAPKGFASLSSGAGQDRAFVRGLCRGDSNQSTCLANLQEAVRDFGGRCVSSRSAAAWYDKCCITYADTNDTKDYEKILAETWYDGNKVSDPTSFQPTYEALMSRVVAKAARSARMFATGEMEYYNGTNPSGPMYGLVQCMRDISAAECEQCLRALVPQLSTCCVGYQGGVSRNFNCNLRIQIYTYYDTALDAPPSAAPPPWPVPSLSPPGERHGKRRSEHVVLAVALSIGTLLVLVAVLVFVHLQRRKIKATNKQHGMYVEGRSEFIEKIKRVDCGLL